MTAEHSFHIPEFLLGHRMGLALQDAGHSVQDAADYFGCSRQTIGNWINNRIVPGLGEQRLWALWTGVPLQWLQTGQAPDPQGGGVDNTTQHITGCYPLRLIA